jgi:GT2 family glycosyltransferase
MAALPRYGAVVLTQGRRPKLLRGGVTSLLNQRGVQLDVAVVGNGWQPSGLPAGVHSVVLETNVGIPAGRNAGVPYVSGDLLFFLDDDAVLLEPDTLCRIAQIFAEEPDIGLIQPRVDAADGGPAPRRWTPRLRVGDPTRSSDVTAVWEGAVAVRRELFERVGGWPAEFFAVHEGIDLAWAVWDAGARVRYAGDLVAVHPAVSPARHPSYTRLAARNRVFLARRRLPVPINVLYVAVWAGLTVVRARDMRTLRESWRGALAGLREDAGRRRRMSWRTVWRMTKTGRPPVI